MKFNYEELRKLEMIDSCEAGLRNPCQGVGLPDTSGLRIITVIVRGSDPRWQTIDPMQYGAYTGSVQISDVPVNRLDRKVTVAVFPAGYFKDSPTYQALKGEIVKRKLAEPDRAVAETALEFLWQEGTQHPILGVCGIRKGDDERVCYILVCRSGRYLSRTVLTHWATLGQFVAVVSEEPLE